jgi:hypothetical protein
MERTCVGTLLSFGNCGQCIFNGISYIPLGFAFVTMYVSSTAED